MWLLCLLLILTAAVLLRALLTRGEVLTPAAPADPEQSESYARRLSRMIRCATVSEKDGFDDTEFAALRQVMAEEFPLIHGRCSRHTFGNDCWVYRLPGRDPGRHILLMSHHDVVAAEGEWQQPPFSGAIAEGKLWGRGTVDTKTPLFGEFAALEELLAEGWEPECTVWLASSHNEEIAGNGIPEAARWFREQGIRFELVLDEGGAVIDPPVGGLKCGKCAMVAIHEKGRHKVRLSAREEKGHGSLTAGKGTPPVQRMAAFITEISEKPGFIRRLNPQIRGMLEAMAPYAAFPLKAVLANLWLFGPVLKLLLPKLSPQAGGLLGTTCSFRGLRTEEGETCCRAEAMLRSVDGADFERDYDRFCRIAQKQGIAVEKTDDWEFHAPADPSLPAFGAVAACIRACFPDVPVIPFILPAGTDGRTLTELCPCVVRFAPIRLSGQQLASVHGKDENIDVTAVGDCVVFYRRLLREYR